MKIEIEKEDFVRLAVYASCADLPEKENKYKTTFTRIMDSLDKEDANAIAVDMLAWRARIEVLNGASVEELVKAALAAMMGDDENEK